MKSSYKVYIVGNDKDVYDMFERNGWEVVNSMRYADIIQFTGGEDISPVLYSQTKHAKTRNINPWRDKTEAIIFNLCLQHKKKVAGICRGMQLINSLSGGTMWQDVDGHYTPHKVHCDFYNFDYYTNSIHHQQIIPCNKAYAMAFASCATKKEKMDEYGHLDIYRPTKALDPEVVLFEQQGAFGVQWHPEYPCEKQPDLDEIYIHYLHDALMDDK